MVIIHPDIKNSATAQFESYLGLENSKKRVELKECLLTKPSHRVVQDTHFQLPLDWSDEDVAFLIGHLELKATGGGIDSEILSSAIEFLALNRRNWIRGDRYEIAQKQVIEFYNFR